MSWLRTIFEFNHWLARPRTRNFWRAFPADGIAQNIVKREHMLALVKAWISGDRHGRLTLELEDVNPSRVVQEAVCWYSVDSRQHASLNDIPSASRPPGLVQPHQPSIQCG